MRILLLVLGLALVGCSLANREGVDASCEDLQQGALNACGEGIITSCKSGKVIYAVCDAKDACEQSWQEPDAYRCSESDPLPELVASGSGGSNAGTGGMESGGTSTGGQSTGDGGMPATGGSDPGSGGAAPASDCVASACVLGTMDNDVDFVVADSSHVYFAGCDSAYSVPKNGGPIIKLADVGPGCQLGGLAVGNGNVLVEYDEVVYRVPVAGGPSTEEVSGETFVGNIAADDTRVFWVGAGARAGVNRQLHGALAETIPDSDAVAEGLLVSGGHVYWSVFNGVERVPVDGAGVQLLNTTERPSGFAVVNGFVYYFSTSSIFSVDVADNAEVMLGAVTEPGQVTANATHVYWTESSGVKAVPVGGGAVETFDGSGVTIRNNVGGIIADADWVIWSDGNNLMKREAL